MRLRGQHGYAMAALLVGMAIMAVVMSAAMPVWKTAAQREKEAELIFRGQQYVRAIELYQRKLPGAVPPNLDVLLDQKFLRKKYKDPITGDDFELLSPNSPMAGLAPPGSPAGRGSAPAGARGAAPAGRGGVSSPVATPARGGIQSGTIGAAAGITGISGVVSKSKASSLRLYNGRSHYNEWQFVYVPRAAAPGAGAPGVATPGQRGVQPGVGPGGRGRGDGRGFPPGRGDGRGFPPPGGRGPFGPGSGPFQPGVPPSPQQPQRPPG